MCHVRFFTMTNSQLGFRYFDSFDYFMSTKKEAILLPFYVV